MPQRDSRKTAPRKATARTRPPRTEPGLRTQWLAQELRKLRSEAGLSMADIGAYIRRDQSTISRMEKGEIPIRVTDVLAYLDMGRINDTNRREMLKQLAHEIWRDGWWDGYTGDAAATLIDRLWVESRTKRIRSYEMLVPGLLQTKAHAEATMRAVEPDSRPEQIKRWLQIRLERQAILTADEPIDLNVIIDESVLHRPVGTRLTRRAQFEHLVELSERDNVEIRVLPYKAGAHTGMAGAFELMDLAQPFPTVGYVETQVGAIFVEGKKVARLEAAYDHLLEAALDPRRSVALIRSVINELE
ncbi:helix-turn-helix domain-containing protein [Actinocatenispora rupis]|uniref:Transcriptional regulator n=1 Tax=Actinocatenispora rupis TaxID=519421 RepID=A0A8J3N7Q4_9ACTN|nr:helix-turn-helix transcriptional regulator [Actinocatenispora rupis]GID09529.1 transcriptional regulator [Actinocatenispora rupis]